MKITDSLLGTFGCPNTRAKASQLKVPSFCLCTNYRENNK